MDKSNIGYCEVCGKKIEKKVFWKKYCSKQCRVIAWAIKLLQEAGYKIIKKDVDKIK